MNYHEDHEKRALNALAEDMASIPSHVVPPCSSEHRDAALGLPLEEPERFDEMTGGFDDNAVLEYAKHAGMRRDPYSPNNGTTPGQQPSRTDAASLSDLRARRQACRVVESAAWNALLESGLTREQLVLLGAYNDSIHATRKAELDMHYAMFAKGGSL